MDGGVGLGCGPCPSVLGDDDCDYVITLFAVSKREVESFTYFGGLFFASHYLNYGLGHGFV